jgi:hypothetical protein
MHPRPLLFFPAVFQGGGGLLVLLVALLEELEVLEELAVGVGEGGFVAAEAPVRGHEDADGLKELDKVTVLSEGA